MQNLPEWREKLEKLNADLIEQMREEGFNAAGINEQKRIKSALARVADGKFGTCTECGNPIDEVRLDVIPFAELCRTCVQTEEALKAMEKKTP